ncbi:hypothetical protein [Micromonospora sp. NPDC049900]|uniref:hypothetical protein n=1 Tax=unclassified Micromonospora TaxID=2617518 RepID=UPI003790413E
MPVQVDVVDTVSGWLTEVTVPLRATDGDWVVLRISDPALPNGTPGPVGHPGNDFGVADTGPWWLRL